MFSSPFNLFQFIYFCSIHKKKCKTCAKTGAKLVQNWCKTGAKLVQNWCKTAKHPPSVLQFGLTPFGAPACAAGLATYSGLTYYVSAVSVAAPWRSMKADACQWRSPQANAGRSGHGWSCLMKLRRSRSGRPLPSPSRRIFGRRLWVRDSRIRYQSRNQDKWYELGRRVRSRYQK